MAPPDVTSKSSANQPLDQKPSSWVIVKDLLPRYSQQTGTFHVSPKHPLPSSSPVQAHGFATCGHPPWCRFASDLSEGVQHGNLTKEMDRLGSEPNLGHHPTAHGKRLLGATTACRLAGSPATNLCMAMGCHCSPLLPPTCTPRLAWSYGSYGCH